MTSSRKVDLHILGAGPAGLAVGYYAKKNNIQVRLYESSNNVGGNCKTITHGEFSFDTGAHRFHDKYNEITSEIKNLLGDDLLHISAPSQIYRKGQLIDFPLNLKNLLLKLGFSQLMMIAYENFIKRFRYNHHPKNFKDLSYQIYGKTLSELFLINYTKKLWGQDPVTLESTISGDRLKNLDLASIISEIFIKTDNNKHLDGSFYYPKYGFGSIFNRIRDNIGSENVKLNSPVKELIHDGYKIKEIIYGGNKVADVEMVINSLPINILVNILNPSPPKEIIEIVTSLKYRSLRLCICYLDMPHFSDKASIYFPEKTIPFTRIYEPKNRSKEMAPKEKTCIVIEIPYSNGDKISSQTPAQLFEHIRRTLIENKLIKKDKIIDYSFINMDYAYPVLDVNIKKILGPVFSYLGRIKNMYHIGRGAEFKYLHTHNIFRNADNFIRKMLQ